MRGRDLAAGPEEVGRSHPTRLGRARARRVGGIEDVDVDGEEGRPVADDLERLLDARPDPALAHVVHEEARDPALRLPAELLLGRPVAAQADLDVPARVDVPLLDEAVHRGSVRELGAEYLRARVRVRVEVDEPDRAVAGGDGTNVRLGDRVVASEHDRQRAGVHDLADEPLDRLVRADGVGRDHRRVAVVDDPERGERVDPGLQVRARRAARGPDRPRPEARAGPVRDEVVHRRADDRHVHARELAAILGVRRAAERQQPGVVGLVGEPVRLAPACDGIDQGARRVSGASWRRPCRP